MSHLPILPVLIPLAAAVVGLFVGRFSIGLQRAVGFGATLLTAGAAIALLGQVAGGSILPYRLGDWPAPWGILLIADRTSSMFVVLTLALAIAAQLYAMSGIDRSGRYFHALFQFQLAGVHGAFLTGDLFNLFVFFEILLAASYTLLLHGGQPRRVRMALHFVLLNLVGSALFLVGVSTLYGVTGTLNMAHIAVRVGSLSGAEAELARAAGYLLMVVFGLKAAALPLGFWLPRVYGAATAPVAALFAIMTKVGVYALLRVNGLIFGSQAGELAGLAWPVLTVAGLITLLLGAWAVLSANRLTDMAGWLVVASVGSMLAVAGQATPRAVGAALYYLLHSTLAAALFYLVASLLSQARGGDQLRPGPRPVNWGQVGALFGFSAIASVGLPPLGGFLGKLLMLDSTAGSSVGWTVWAAVLTGGLAMIVGLSRAFSVLVWRAGPAAPPEAAVTPTCPWKLVSIAWLMALLVGLVAAAGPIHAFARNAAAQLLSPRAMISAVLEGK